MGIFYASREHIGHGWLIVFEIPTDSEKTRL